MLKKYQINWQLLFVLLLLIYPTSCVFANNDSSLSNKGTIKFEINDWETNPIDPEKPGTSVDPGGEIVKTNGLLRLDFVPKLSFGSQAITNDNRTYYANAQLFKGETGARGNYIQVTDNRANLSGWQLSVRQETQFKNDQTKNKELNGATISFDKQWANSVISQSYKPMIVKEAIKINQIGTTYPIAISEKGKGAGTWTISFGSSGEIEGVENTLKPILNADGAPLTDPTVGDKAMYKNEAISLFVPGKTLKDPVKYTTVLTWIISELT